jgi:hypothetical protein
LKSKIDFQRALVFQGGGSLGAYEAGVYEATYELLSERDVKLGREGKPLFHIVEKVYEFTSKTKISPVLVFAEISEGGDV